MVNPSLKSSPIIPPKDYKIVEYSEWGGRYLPKTGVYLSSLTGVWVPVTILGACRYTNPDCKVAIPNNHIPRSKIRETNRIRRHVLSRLYS